MDLVRTAVGSLLRGGAFPGATLGVAAGAQRDLD